MNLPLRFIFAGAFGAALLFSNGCTANQQYRTNYEPANATGAPAKPDDTIVSIEGGKIGFVEIDDQGWFWDRHQWDAVQTMIKQEASLDQPDNAPPQPVLLVLFVHGWKHNASASDKNVECFKRTLETLSAAEKSDSEHENRAPRRVLGVYVGWRGLSATLEPFEELSFYERKNSAHKVGHGALTELLVRLEGLETLSNLRLTRTHSIPPDGTAPGTELVVVGHSFGGAVVYSALSQILVERFVADTNNQRVLKPFGSLVILINPAFEATLYNDLNDLATTQPSYPAEQRPVTAIFTSKADWATKYAFTVGRFFSTLFEKHRTDQSQREANITAVGHFFPYTTHDLIYDPNAKLASLPQASVTANLPPASSPTGTAASPTPTTPEKIDTATAFALLKDPARLRASAENLKQLRHQWKRDNAAETAVATPRDFTFDDCRLAPRKNYKAGDPFLVVSVDKEIIRDHNDIAEPVFINFLREFIAFSRKNSPPPDTH